MSPCWDPRVTLGHPLVTPGDFETPGGVPYEVVEVPYAGGGVAMLLAVPLWRGVPIASLTRHLDAQLVTTWVTHMRLVPRVLVLPR